MTNKKADEFGRYRVLDKDTGHKLSVVASQLPHGHFTVLDEDASDVGGDGLPVEYAKSTAPSGRQAETSKES